MKKLILALAVFFVALVSVQAQEDSFSKKMGFGFHLGQFQKDFGLGMNVTSPFFANDRMALRARGNLVWNEHLGTDGTIGWTPYSNVSFGVVAVAGEIGNFGRVYGEGGLMMLFPSKDFSTKSNEIGGYGSFGFEFFFQKCLNYYIEIGGLGTGAHADKIAGQPIYSNGMVINVGFRAYLK